MKRLRKWIRNYFGFSKTETNGFIILIPLMFFFLSAPTLYTRFFSSSYDNLEVDKNLLDSLVAHWNENARLKDNISKDRTSDELPIVLKAFDPNQVSTKEMLSLGIPYFLTYRIQNYRAKGGKFRIKEDLGKIYDFPDSLLEALRGYIDLPDQLPVKENTPIQPSGLSSRTIAPAITKSANESAKEIFKIDINGADTTSFKKLRGIGSVYAKRIVGYRKILGGFTRLEQLLEVYGIEDSLYQTLVPHLILDNDLLKVSKININLATFKEINRHPYISFDQTKDILNVKSKYGKFRSLQDLTKVTSLTQKDLDRLKPYLRFQ